MHNAQKRSEATWRKSNSSSSNALKYSPTYFVSHSKFPAKTAILRLRLCPGHRGDSLTVSPSAALPADQDHVFSSVYAKRMSNGEQSIDNAYWPYATPDIHGTSGALRG